MSGGIAAYKACELLRRFTESGHDVTVVPTAAALEFVGATWSALSGKPVPTDVRTGVHEVPHVRIGQGADLVVVAPATADLLAKAAHGLADDLLTNTLLTARCLVVFAPAMHTEMWEHPATQANVATLRSRGAVVIEPAEGRLTGVDTGKGRLPEAAEIFDACRDVLASVAAPDLAGRHVVARRWHPGTSTRCASSATASASGLRPGPRRRRARRRSDPGQRQRRPARPRRREGRAGRDDRSAARRRRHRDGLRRRGGDGRGPRRLPARRGQRQQDQEGRRRLGGALALIQNPDILHEISTDRARPGSVIVGFAAETGDDTGSVLDLARAKLARVTCSWSTTSAGAVFGSPDNEAVILAADGAVVDVPHGSKSALARHLGRSGLQAAGLRRRPGMRDARYGWTSPMDRELHCGWTFTSESVTEGHPTRSRTRSATPCWTRCSRRTPTPGSRWRRC